MRHGPEPLPALIISAGRRRVGRPFQRSRRPLAEHASPHRQTHGGAGLAGRSPSAALRGLPGPLPVVAEPRRGAARGRCPAARVRGRPRRARHPRARARVRRACALGADRDTGHLRRPGVRPRVQADGPPDRCARRVLGPRRMARVPGRLAVPARARAAARPRAARGRGAVRRRVARVDRALRGRGSDGRSPTGPRGRADAAQRDGRAEAGRVLARVSTGTAPTAPSGTCSTSTTT